MVLFLIHNCKQGILSLNRPPQYFRCFKRYSIVFLPKKAARIARAAFLVKNKEL